MVCSELPLRRSGGKFSPSVWPHNPATGFRPPSATVVSAEPFAHGTGTVRCMQKEMATDRHWSVSLWREPDDVSHCRILSPDKTEWRLNSATLSGWRRYFVPDQLWLMKRIYEKKKKKWAVNEFTSYSPLHGRLVARTVRQSSLVWLDGSYSTRSSISQSFHLPAQFNSV